jgi:translation initiation factor RLI1
LTLTSTRKRRKKNTENHTEEKKKEIISETHLTASGVCTTICPENSGM